jgi:hypothetical protein
MTTLSGITQGVFVEKYIPIVDRHGDYHLIINTKQGDVVHIMPYKGIIKNIFKSRVNDFRPYFTYSYLSDCFYFADNEASGILTEYGLRDGTVKTYPFSDIGKPFSKFSAVAQTGHRVYNFNRSTDGHVYIGEFGTHTVGGYIRFNVVTKEFDDYEIYPDKEFSHIQSRRQFPAVKVNNTPFEGVYSPYLFDNNYEELWTILKTEISSAGYFFYRYHTAQNKNQINQHDF